MDTNGGETSQRIALAKKYVEIMKQQQHPSGPLERVRLLTVALDAFLTDKEGRTQNFYFSMGVDEYTGCVLGTYLGPPPEDFRANLRFLRKTIIPSACTVRRHLRIDGPSGRRFIPKTLVVDRSLEFTGLQFQQACRQLGIILQHEYPSYKYHSIVEKRLGTKRTKKRVQQHLKASRRSSAA